MHASWLRVGFGIQAVLHSESLSGFSVQDLWFRGSGSWLERGLGIRTQGLVSERGMKDPCRAPYDSFTESQQEYEL